MDSPTLRRQLSSVAHSLAARDGSPALRRPQYFAMLVSALRESDRSGIRQLAVDETIAAISAQCKVPVPDEAARALLWEAFGSERIDTGADLTLRQRAAKRLDSLLADPDLPAEAAFRARDLGSHPEALPWRILPLQRAAVAAKLYPNPLSPLESVMALADWKLGRLSSRQDALAGWVTNTVYQQVRFRFFQRRLPVGDMEDISQPVVTAILQRLCAYQPVASLTLERWTFNAISLAIAMELRRSDRVREKEVAVGALNATEAWAVLSGPAIDVYEADRRRLAREIAEDAARAISEARIFKVETRIEKFLESFALLGGVDGSNNTDLFSRLDELYPEISPELRARIALQANFGEA